MLYCGFLGAGPCLFHSIAKMLEVESLLTNDLPWNVLALRAQRGIIEDCRKTNSLSVNKEACASLSADWTIKRESS